jgi:hypothetical protein
MLRLETLPSYASGNIYYQSYPICNKSDQFLPQKRGKSEKVKQHRFLPYSFTKLEPFSKLYEPSVHSLVPRKGMH